MSGYPFASVVDFVPLNNGETSKLNLFNGTTEYISVQASPDMSTTFDLKLPSEQGTTGQILELVDASTGQTEWQDLPPALPTPASENDVLVFSAGAWVPTSSLPAHKHAALKGLSVQGGQVTPESANRIGNPLGSGRPRTLTIATTAQGSEGSKGLYLNGLGNFGNPSVRAFADTNIFSVVTDQTNATNPVLPLSASGVSNGAYHIMARRSEPLLTDDIGFYVTKDGNVRLTPRVGLSFTNLLYDPVSSEVFIGVSLGDYKTNVQIIDDLSFLEKIPFAKSYEAISNNLGRIFVSEMVDDIFNSDMTLTQKKYLLDFKYLPPANPASPSFDPTKMSDATQFPNGKFDFTQPVGINQQALLTIIKAYVIAKFLVITPQIAALRSDVDELIGEISLIQSDISSVQSQVASISSAQDQLESSLSTVNSNISTINTNISDLQSQVLSFDNDQDQIEAQVSQLQTSLSTLQTQVTDIDTAQDQLELQVPQLQSAITSINTSISAIQAQITSIDTAQDVLETQVPQLQTSVTTLQTQVANLENLQTILEDAVPQFQADIAAINTNIATLQSQVPQIQTDVSSLQTQVTDLDTAQDQFESQVQTSLSTVTSDITSMQTQITDLSTVQSQLQAQIPQLQTDMSTLISQVSSLEPVVATLNTQVPALETAVTTASTDISSLQTVQSQLQTSTTTLTAQIAALQASDATQSAQIAALQAQMTALIAQLNTQMGIIQSALGLLGQVVSLGGF